MGRLCNQSFMIVPQTERRAIANFTKFALRADLSRRWRCLGRNRMACVIPSASLTSPAIAAPCRQRRRRRPATRWISSQCPTTPRRVLCEPITLVPGWVDLKRDHFRLLVTAIATLTGFGIVGMSRAVDLVSFVSGSTPESGHGFAGFAGGHKEFFGSPQLSRRARARKNT